MFLDFGYEKRVDVCKLAGVVIQQAHLSNGELCVVNPRGARRRRDGLKCTSEPPQIDFASDLMQTEPMSTYTSKQLIVSEAGPNIEKPVGARYVITKRS